MDFIGVGGQGLKDNSGEKQFLWGLSSLAICMDFLGGRAKATILGASPPVDQAIW
jgi:hypothetical protein